jgi:hypothetical protein
MFSYYSYPKPLLFKSFTELAIQEFDNIFDKEIIKRYDKHENQRLSERKEDREKEEQAQEDHSNLT